MVFNLVWPNCPDYLRESKYFPRPEGSPIESSKRACEELAHGIFYVAAGALFIYAAFKLAIQVEQGYQLLSHSFKSAGMSHEGLLTTALVYSIFQWKIGPDSIGWFGREYIGQVTYPRLVNSLSYLVRS